MGVKITDLILRREIELKELSNKTIAIDSSLFLYQFISTIRQMDGTPLMDSKGNVTSHLSGLFFRTMNLCNAGLRLAFVFDGKSPQLKRDEQQRRAGLKEEALKKYDIAKERGDVEEMKKYASRTSMLTKDMIEEAKELIRAMGLPIIQAPAEAEAQAAYLVKKGDAYAVASQDADCLMFGATRMIRNLSVVGKRKKANKLSYDTYKPEMVELDGMLNNLGITQDQLIALGILIGTDFNYGGIKGIGPKNALKLVREYGNRFDDMFRKAEWEKSFDIGWKDIFDLIKNMPITDDYELKWRSMDKEKIYEMLVQRHEFSKERIDSAFEKAGKAPVAKGQKGLGEFF